MSNTQVSTLHPDCKFTVLCIGFQKTIDQILHQTVDILAYDLLFRVVRSVL